VAAPGLRGGEQNIRKDREHVHHMCTHTAGGAARAGAKVPARLGGAGVGASSPACSSASFCARPTVLAPRASVRVAWSNSGQGYLGPAQQPRFAADPRVNARADPQIHRPDSVLAATHTREQIVRAVLHTNSWNQRLVLARANHAR